MSSGHNKLAILINTKDRVSELSLLLQSLRTQTFQDFDIFILDDKSITPLNQYHFFNCVLNRLKCENHCVLIKNTEFPYGVSRARQSIVDWAMEYGYDYYLRVDDDVVLEKDYIERLLYVIDKGYDIASGVTVVMYSPSHIRNPDFLNGIVNRIILNEKGEYVYNGDDCGIEYTENVIFPAHHFRSCALIKREVHQKVKYYPTRLSMNGFREEQVFSLKAIMEGFKIGVDTGAVNYHQLTPTGGERATMNMGAFNQEILEEFTKENKDKLIPLFSKIEDIDIRELEKSTNLIFKKEDKK
jgi:GT2 family glycosyltransferase